MSNNSFMFQYLKEKINKGFPAPLHSDMLNNGSYIYIPKNSEQPYCSPDTNDLRPSQESAPNKVAMFFDGPFFPIRNGACYNIHNLMRTLGDTKEVDVHFMNCYRGWGEVDDYYNRNFSTTLIGPDDYYTETGLMDEIMRSQGIKIAHFFDTEVLINIAPRLKKLGIKIVLETQNIDHVLLERLRVSPDEVIKARAIQAGALRMADFNLFRSDIDMEWGLSLGANPTSAATYRGGICVDDFTFNIRKGMKNLVFLGHMFYQPNENALHAIIAKILPRLPDDYSLTVIGIAPPKLIETYKHVPNVTFLEGVDDLDKELKAYDVALAPLFEGSGTRLKLLDYLASGLPVIATSVAAEGLDAAIHSYLIIEDDISKYAALIESITSDPQELAIRAQKGREFVERVYDWPNCIDPFLDAYRTLTSTL